MNIKVKKLHDKAALPTCGSEDAAGYDIRAFIMNEEGGEGTMSIPPHQTVMVHTGLCMAPPKGYWIGIYPRSGLASKKGLRPANCVGVCDSDYRGEYMVALHNDSESAWEIVHGERIAQLILHQRNEMNFISVPELDNTERGSGGFGSTGN